MLDSTGMARRKDLRELDKTRGSRGQFTSETSYRVHQVKAAKGLVRQMREDKFKLLAEAREMLRLYRLMQKGKTDPKLTRDGYSPRASASATSGVVVRENGVALSAKRTDAYWGSSDAERSSRKN
jgi:hypothetical protein